MNKSAKIFIAGHKGLVGSAIYRKLIEDGFTNIVVKHRQEVDLLNQAETFKFFQKEAFDYVILAAAKVGGINANSTYPAEFIYENIMIAANVIHSAYKSGVKKLINLGSSCIYPANINTAIKETDLLNGKLEPTNEAYAIAKISAIKLCKFYNEQYGTNFISLMPTNLYGINDNFNMETAHVLPALLRKFHLAKLLMQNDFTSIIKDLKNSKLGWNIDENIDFDNLNSIEQALNQTGIYKDKVVLWGDGTPYREFMSSDDLADACLYLLKNKNYNDIGEIVNITSGTDIQLKDLYETIKNIVGYQGNIEYNTEKPNGVYRKLLDDTKIKELGWQPKIDLETGVRNLYSWYISNSQKENTGKNIVIKLFAGLGNQLFQYALGYAITKTHGQKLYFDLSEYKAEFARKYELNKFNIEENICTDDIKVLPEFNESQYNFMPNVLNINTSMKLTGYWQSDKYFKNFREDLIKQLTFKNPNFIKDLKYLSAIENYNSVGIQVRLTDYMIPEVRKKHFVCKPSYYQNAINKIYEMVENPIFFVFSDDINYAKMFLPKMRNIFYVESNSWQEDFYYLQRTKHNIISNSTFGWWASWLSYSSEKHIIVPNKWLTDEAQLNYNDIYPESWIKVNVD